MKALERTIAAATACLLTVQANAQGISEYERLRIENISLRMTVDSLSRELRSLKGISVINLWDNLADIDEGDDFTMDYNGFGLAPTRRETDYARGITASVPSLSLPYDPVLRKYVDLYSVTKRRSMPAVIGRFEAYLPQIRAAFSRYGVPEDLAALCIVESAVSVKALSKAGALGMWQLMPATARQYGLRVDDIVDERLDVSRATDAAARLLRDLKKSLGSWPLAVMAYNCGSGNVRKAVVRSGGGRDVWALSEYLPAETQAYIPSLVGARYTYLHRQELGIETRSYRTPAVETVSAARTAGLDEVAEKTGTPAATVAALNPHLVAGIAPEGCRLNLPAGTARKAAGCELF